MSEVERHPFEPFLPVGSKMLMLGSFPPAPRRWCMEFYYPNFTNDMWRILGYIFFKDKDYFVDHSKETFYLDKLKDFLTRERIGQCNIAATACRKNGTAADKGLKVIEPLDIAKLLRESSDCKILVTTGGLATKELRKTLIRRDLIMIDEKSREYSIPSRLKMGESVRFIFKENYREMSLYRMPSSSPAYPMKIDRKAEIYAKMFKELGMLIDKENN